MNNRHHTTDCPLAIYGIDELIIDLFPEHCLISAAYRTSLVTDYWLYHVGGYNSNGTVLVFLHNLSNGYLNVNVRTT